MVQSLIQSLNSGFVYGAKKKKTLRIFIDDIHLPKHDICDVQSSNQLLRQLVDQQMIYTLQSKHFKPKYIEGMNLLTSFNSSNVGVKNGLQRLLVSFFCIFEIFSIFKHVWTYSPINPCAKSSVKGDWVRVYQSQMTSKVFSHSIALTNTNI